MTERGYGVAVPDHGKFRRCRVPNRSWKAVKKLEIAKVHSQRGGEILKSCRWGRSAGGGRGRFSASRPGAA